MNNDEQDKNQTIQPNNNQNLPNPNQYFQPSQNIQPNNPGQTPVNTPIPPQPNYDQYFQPKSRGPKKILIIVGAIVLLLSAILIGYAMIAGNDKSSNSSQSQQSAVTVPSEWKTIETDFGFSFKAPQAWESTDPEDSSVDNIRSDTLTVGTPDDSDEDTEADIEEARYEYVTVGLQSLTDSSSQEDFEKLVTNADGSLVRDYQELGVTEDQIKITSKKVDVAGREWLQVDTEIDGQFSRNFYSWKDDKAIVLSVIEDDTTRLETMTNQYLLPMAASIEVK